MLDFSVCIAYNNDMHRELKEIVGDEMARNEKMVITADERMDRLFIKVVKIAFFDIPLIAWITLTVICLFWIGNGSVWLVTTTIPVLAWLSVVRWFVKWYEKHNKYNKSKN